ncbi:rRNA methyltransferase 1, mitochondrial [Sorex fumeus]|uniref:rRNA methyltransferase 1, mitochondrial n=1 Tax=Sorex fumeus TaxID=62283 RepID=UPI0024AD68E2|nr:rRNA methyltransferase 1, mitochondrial [Sorex fumeus]
MWLDSKANVPPWMPSAGGRPGERGRRTRKRSRSRGLRAGVLGAWGQQSEGPWGAGFPAPVPGGDLAATALFVVAESWRRSGALLARPCSQWTRGGQRPGGQELRRLLQDELAPAPPASGRLELLYGLSPCLLALRAARRHVTRLLLQAGRSGLQGDRAELLREAEARNIPVLRPRRQKLDALCHHQVHQGVCMEVSPLQPEPWTEARDTKPQDALQQLWLVLEGLQDPRNLGAVLRSAYFLGVDKIITSRRNSCPLTPVVSKASAGAMEVMAVFSTDDLAGFLQTKARQGWLVAGTVGCTPDSSHHPEVPVTSCLEFQWDQPTLLVLGNEGAGLSPEAQASCQVLLTVLPGRQLTPGLESLNVSVAAGILLHSICSQRKGQRGRPAQDSPEPSATLKGPE